MRSVPVYKIGMKVRRKTALTNGGSLGTWELVATRCVVAERGLGQGLAGGTGVSRE